LKQLESALISQLVQQREQLLVGRLQVVDRTASQMASWTIGKKTGK
jgi:hypothetical protein